MVQFSDLPPEVLEQIFQNLDTVSLARVTEVSSEYNNLISASEKLVKKFTLFIKYPLEERSISEMLLRSRRRYRNLSLTRVWNRHSEPIPQQGNNLLARLGNTVTSLKMNWTHVSRVRGALRDDVAERNPIRDRRERRREFFREHGRGNVRGRLRGHGREHVRERIQEHNQSPRTEFVEMMRNFSLVKVLNLQAVQLEVRKPIAELPLNFSHLTDLIMKNCDAHCVDLINSCTSLEKINFQYPYWNSSDQGINTFEKLLVKQDRLVDLELHNFTYPRLFIQDRSETIKFQLRRLILRSVMFGKKESAENFFRTQHSIRHIEFQIQNETVRKLDEIFWYNNILKSILLFNREMETLKIKKIKYRLDDLDFLEGVRNYSIKHLDYNATSEDKTARLFKVLCNLSPNLETIIYKAEKSVDIDGICFEENTRLDNVKSLAITNSSVRSLANLYAEKLEHLVYSPGNTGECIDNFFGTFVHNHRNIKTLVVGKCSENSYFFVSYMFCEQILNFLSQLEAITIYNFNEINRSVRLLCTLPKLKVLTVSLEQEQQFTAKTKTECAQKQLELITIDIPRVSNED